MSRVCVPSRWSPLGALRGLNQRRKGKGHERKECGRPKLDVRLNFPLRSSHSVLNKKRRKRRRAGEGLGGIEEKGRERKGSGKGVVVTEKKGKERKWAGKGVGVIED